MKPMTLEEAILKAPAIATTEAHPHKGVGFAHINTENMLKVMLDSGFAISSARQARGVITTRGVNTGLYNQHVIRLRDASKFENLSVGDSIPEIVMVNSHDGSGCFTLMAGLFRLICLNGMTTGETQEYMKAQHRWLDDDEFLHGAKEVWSHVGSLVEWQARASELRLTAAQQHEFAKQAQILRFPTAQKMPFDSDLLLDPRRDGDSGVDLWHTFQRVQENSMKGGIAGRSATNRLTKMRSITGVQADIDLNRGLWDLADSFLEAA